MLAFLTGPAAGGELVLLHKQPDPFGYPRPYPGATDVPLRSSLFIQLGFRQPAGEQAAKRADTILPDSVRVQIREADGAWQTLLDERQQAAAGVRAAVDPSRDPPGGLAINLDLPAPLRPATTYSVSVAARSRQGSILNDAAWQFTTAAATEPKEVGLFFGLRAPATQWQGGFFTGFCKPSFCTSALYRLPSYELMADIRRQAPRAWSLQRDIGPTGFDHQPQLLDWEHPHIVRERETRRITALEDRARGTLLRLEDVFGHQQYGIASDRPIGEDFEPGDEVLIADGIHSARARVLDVLDDRPGHRSLLVSTIDVPDGGWKVEYSGPLPSEEEAQAPGLFPPGGCYLRKFKPVGTLHYYWDRLDKEWDIAVRQYGRRLVVNFTDAPGDLAVDGRAWTYPKDYAQYHSVVRDCTAHLIDRYGDRCLQFYWSVFNEPDLSRAFWRSGDWDHLQTFYDYTVDAVLRAFEDAGYDSHCVRVGGLELGGIFGTHLEQPVLKRFLGHCSPTATVEGEVALNAAVADQRLNGRRSQRVEQLAAAHQGRGSPCDFISVHSYNASAVMAAKLQRVKQIALEVDPEFYRPLWVNSFEACPDWAPPADLAAADSYLGNGYFESWCADVIRRQLAVAQADPRYAMGETLLTFWPWPNRNFGGHNNATQVIGIDDDGDGLQDREQSVALPILRLLGLVAQMGDRYWVAPQHEHAGHVVSGFASGDPAQAVWLLLYAHQPLDPQSRSDQQFHLELVLQGLAERDWIVQEYRFDLNHNSYYQLARQLRDGLSTRLEPGAQQERDLLAALASGEPTRQLAAIKQIERLGEVSDALISAAYQLHQATEDDAVRMAIQAAGSRLLTRRRGFAPQEVARVAELSQLAVTGQSEHRPQDGLLRLSVALRANGVTILRLRQPHPLP